ncbi:hypothetical protein C8R44DRAFT_777518 [Mycena epipterygia]|nr:hypothetical protein C8R44DRAFT_777518 [Mycena epipterygia]
MNLQKFPTELVTVVCLWLDALSIVRLAQVCRQFRHILQQSSALQYKIQLELAGLRDGQFIAGSGSAVRLDMLTAYQAAWASFEWTSTSTVEMAGNLWELVSNVLATYSANKGFSFNRIPSASRHVSPAEWAIANVPFTVTDFSMDLSQDLLLAVEFNASKSTVVHLLSLQTGRPHPLAVSSG